MRREINIQFERQQRTRASVMLGGCEKIRTWFDKLTSGVPQWKLKYLPLVVSLPKGSG
jgi:hypothetical protein